MQIASFAELIKYFESEKIPLKADPQFQFVEIPTRSPPLEGSMAVMWDKNDNLIQFIHLLPFTIPPERMAALEAAVTRINHALALPGFGIDHEKLRLYYRIVLPRGLGDGSVDSRTLAPALTTVVNTTRDFLIPLTQVAVHGAAPENVLDAARKSSPTT